jgi:pimeloyl-ACP methyl ester carboxylesterase
LRRAAKIALAALALLVALLVLNAIALSNQTKDARVDVAGARIVETSIGGLQVLDQGDRRGSPIVLLHCYTCSMRWWDRLVPLLARNHRVIRIDLLGHGGSDKPKAGYGMDAQARAVAEVMGELGVTGATVVGHSLGATVATALASQSSELTARVVDIDQAPDNSYGSLPFTAKLGYLPVIGQAIDRLAHLGPASLVEDQYADAFAPGFSIPSGFENPDQVVDDLRAMTYTSYTHSASAEEDYADAQPLDRRLAATGLPVLVIFGAEDQIYDARRALDAFRKLPGVRTALIDGAGHSPNVEKPHQVAALINEFIADQGDEAASEHPPPNVGLRGTKKRQGAGGSGKEGNKKAAKGGPGNP